MLKKNNFLRISLMITIIFIMAGSLLALSSCSSSLAEVNGYKITQKEVDSYTSSLKTTNPEIFEKENSEQLKAVEKQIIDYIIVNKIIEKYGAENNISVVEKEIDIELGIIQDSYGSKADFQKYLADNNINEDFLKVWLKDQILGSKVYESITENISVTDEEIQNYYDENKDTVFKTPEQVEVSHILVKFGENDTVQKTKEEALEKIKVAQEKLNDGGLFEDIANRYSEDENTNTIGGVLGYFSKGQLVSEFEDVAFQLKIGEVSDIVETTYGFHIIKVTNKKVESTNPFIEVKEQIKDYLLKDLKSKKWEDFILDLKDKSEINYSAAFQASESTETTAGTDSQEIGTDEESPIEEQLITPST
ncbi:MAG: peptidylprolyl isomerase [Actinomycetota bacterium]|nr:peptidylprolyl isomerase [Actinomycetota bacterium]